MNLQIKIIFIDLHISERFKLVLHKIIFKNVKLHLLIEIILSQVCIIYDTVGGQGLSMFLMRYIVYFVANACEI
jgi:hypothetical protein